MVCKNSSRRTSWLQKTAYNVFWSKVYINFETVEFFGMSSYWPNFPRPQKYVLQAFQNRAGNYSSTSYWFFRSWNVPTWLSWFSWPLSERYEKINLWWMRLLLWKTNEMSWNNSRHGFEKLEVHTFGFWKMWSIRTHPEELHGPKFDIHFTSNTHYRRFLKPWSSSGWVLTGNIFQEPESIYFKLCKTVSGIILRYFITFLEHETYPLDIAHFPDLNMMGMKNQFIAGVFDALKNQWDVVK